MKTAKKDQRQIVSTIFEQNIYLNIFYSTCDINVLTTVISARFGLKRGCLTSRKERQQKSGPKSLGAISRLEMRLDNSDVVQAKYHKHEYHLSPQITTSKREYAICKYSSDFFVS